MRSVRKRWRSPRRRGRLVPGREVLAVPSRPRAAPGNATAAGGGPLCCSLPPPRLSHLQLDDGGELSPCRVPDHQHGGRFPRLSSCSLAFPPPERGMLEPISCLQWASNSARMTRVDGAWKGPGTPLLLSSCYEPRDMRSVPPPGPHDRARRGAAPAPASPEPASPEPASPESTARPGSRGPEGPGRTE